MESRTNTLAYINLIQPRFDVHPNLWVPVVTSDGKSANLYGNSWHDLLEKNLRAANYALQRP